MEKFNKLSLSTTILIGCVILGGFYYFSQVSKQNSIERQQLTDLNAKQKIEQEQRDREAWDRLNKMYCVDEAKLSAKSQYKDICTYDCKEGYYYTANYETYYNTCLQRKGLN